MTEFVRIAHPNVKQTAECPVKALDHWRQSGWYPIDPEHQTPTEMVEQRVRDLEHQAQLGVVADTP
jgi:hypothetical protein